MKNTNKTEVNKIEKKLIKVFEKIYKKKLITMADMGDYIEKTFSEREMIIILCNDFKDKYKIWEDTVANRIQKQKENLDTMYG